MGVRHAPRWSRRTAARAATYLVSALLASGAIAPRPALAAEPKRPDSLGFGQLKPGRYRGEEAHRILDMMRDAQRLGGNRQGWVLASYSFDHGSRGAWFWDRTQNTVNPEGRGLFVQTSLAVRLEDPGTVLVERISDTIKLTGPRRTAPASSASPMNWLRPELANFAGSAFKRTTVRESADERTEWLRILSANGTARELTRQLDPAGLLTRSTLKTERHEGWSGTTMLLGRGTTIYRPGKSTVAVSVYGSGSRMDGTVTVGETFDALTVLRRGADGSWRAKLVDTTIDKLRHLGVGAMAVGLDHIVKVPREAQVPLVKALLSHHLFREKKVFDPSVLRGEAARGLARRGLLDNRVLTLAETEGR